MGIFHKLVFRKFTFEELWFLSKKKPGQFLPASLVKIFGGSIPCCSDVPNVESIADLRCGEESIPPFVREIFLPFQNQLTALGFHSQVYYALWDSFHVNRIYRVEYAAPNSDAFARIHYRQWEKAYPPKTTTSVVFCSLFASGRMLVSTSAEWSTAPANVILKVRPKTAPEALWQSHLEQLGQLQESTYQMSNADSLIWASEKYHADFFNFYRQRGLFQPLTDAEQKSEVADRVNYTEMQSAGKQYPEILVEIKKLQEQKTTKWTRLLGLLAVSAIVFLAMGAKSWGKNYALLLIPVLLFHEAGHYLMMKIFGYRNLKMFFIPLFGAAVAGRHYNVPGWKKVVVSLMGPTPGIILGAILGCLSLVIHNAFLQKFSLILLILNGFNLVPFLPLDGGWAMQGIVFSRHYFFDVGFKVIAALAMLGLGLLLKTNSLIVVSAATLVALPAALNIAKATTNLRKAGFVAVSPDDQNIPDSLAETIITELKATMPKTNKVGTAKNMARLTLQVFENLNAKPPGWEASIGLLTWYGAAVLMAVFFCFIMIAAQGGGLGRLISTAAFGPKMKYACQSVKVVRHGASQEATLNIVATMSKPTAADAAFTELSAQLGDQESLEKIGQTLILKTSAVDKKSRQNWVSRFETYSTNTFVDWTNNVATFTILCVAPSATAASNLTEEINEFFNLPQQGYFLIPPWATEDNRPTAQKVAEEKARHTYWVLVQSGGLNFDFPALLELQKKQADARRHGDSEQVKDLSQQIDDMTKAFRKKSFEKAREDKTLDAALIDLYEKRDGLAYTNAARAELSHQLTKTLGVAGEQHQPLNGPGLLAARSGTANANGLAVSVSYICFADSFTGAPAFLDWLCAKNCIGIRYSVSSTPYFGDESLSDD